MLFSSVTLGAFACSDADKGPGYATPVLSCEVEGMGQCETRVLVRANTGVPPFIEFGAYDLNGPIDSGFAVLFSSNNVDSRRSSVEQLCIWSVANGGVHRGEVQRRHQDMVQP